MKKTQNAGKLALIKKKVVALQTNLVKGGGFNSPQLPTDACPSYSDRCDSAKCC